MTVDDVKAALLSSDIEEFVDTYVLGGESSNFDVERVRHVAAKLAERYRVTKASVDIRVVGSAKIGFGLREKTTKSGDVLPRFRPFRPESDIDLAIVSSSLFERLWDELSAHANAQPGMPWDSKKLGDYMVCGWLRPDHFPRGVRLRRCDDWWDLFRELSSDSRFGRRAIRGALYYSLEHLRRYQIRGLAECRSFLETQS